ncbi:DUF2155 domain-containing protein [Amaricoccus tamworthensis]|uniref:DUF2155 domain-containing protein n=1 Tax=Amaricoccus tamworthensis TaxID=57002 RepID=UPI003C79D390
MKRAILAALVLGMLGVPAMSVSKVIEVSPNRDVAETDGVHLRGLDTLNGTAMDLYAPVGETIRYGHLIITADSCRIKSATAVGDDHAFLRIGDVREEGLRFSGWMFASSPALSALDHPRYDVWVVNCNRT